MPLFTGLRRPPSPDQASKEEGLPPDGDSDQPGSGDPDQAATGDGWRGRHPVVARAVARLTTALAAALVLFALLMPNGVAHLTPAAFVRIPIEGILGAAVLLALLPKARRVVVLLAGVGIGLLTMVKFLDVGFYASLDRPFDLVLDWTLFDDTASFLRDSAGQAGMLGAVAGVVLIALALPVLMTLAVVRLSHLMARNSVAATRTVWVAGIAWVTCAALGVQIAGLPVASRNTAGLVHERAHQVIEGVRDERAFAEEAAADAFGGTPADRLLTGLRGKDVVFAFVESYGRSAIEHPEMAPQVDAVLADGDRRLRGAGFSARSAFLTSPTAGGGSWLAHSTFLSGLWIKNERRFRSLTASDRLTLTGAFRRAGAWRTVGVMPGVTRTWPEGRFYGLDNIYDARHMGYKGPKFGWSPVPDQYSLAAFERLEHGKPGHGPLMTEIILTSSHNPWAPLPKMIGWDEVGDGSAYHAIKKEGKRPKEVWKDPAQVRTEYRRAIEYSLSSLITYVEKYGDDDTVLVFLGDHEPVPTVTGDNAGRDVPITIVARDPAVLDRISGWRWNDGLNPGPKAPVWRMDGFRDRFMTAYGPQPGKK